MCSRQLCRPHSSASTHSSICLASARRGAAAGPRAPSNSGQSPESCPFPGLSCSSSANLLSSSQFEKHPTRWYCIISMEAFQHTEDLEIKSENFSSSLSSISFPEITAINSKVTFLPDFCLHLHLYISSIPPPPKMHHTLHIVQQLTFSPHTQLSVSTHMCMLHAKSLQSCPTLCDPMDCSLPGSSVHGILQARILEGVCHALQRIFLT